MVIWRDEHSSPLPPDEPVHVHKKVNMKNIWIWIIVIVFVGVVGVAYGVLKLVAQGLPSG
jgi:hypothetical protein